MSCQNDCIKMNRIQCSDPCCCASSNCSPCHPPCCLLYPIGITGPIGPAGNTSDCACTEQMRNVLQQIIQLYSTNNILVTLESGNSVSGRPNSLLTAVNPGLLQLANEQGVVQEAIPLCHIVSVQITGATYNNSITYLPTPTPAPTGCGADCQDAVRSYLPVGTTDVSISFGTQTIAQGTVLRNESGMLVVAGPNNSEPTFISACKAEILSK